MMFLVFIPWNIEHRYCFWKLVGKSLGAKGLLLKREALGDTHWNVRWWMEVLNMKCWNTFPKHSRESQIALLKGTTIKTIKPFLIYTWICSKDTFSFKLSLHCVSIWLTVEKISSLCVVVFMFQWKPSFYKVTLSKNSLSSETWAV